MGRCWFLFVLTVATVMAALGGGSADDRRADPAVGVAKDDPRLVAWATGLKELVRGPQDAAKPDGPKAWFGEGQHALGPVDGKVVSLGDGGHITVSFAHPIRDGKGPDFAVFENGLVGSQPGQLF